MLAVLIALAVFVMAGFAGTALMSRRPAGSEKRDEAQATAGYLSGLHWREFTRLVLQAMDARGYRMVDEEGDPTDDLPSDGGNILLQRGNQRVLLSCKYGNNAVVGALALQALVNEMQLRATNSAIVVSSGRFDEEAARLSKQHLIELVDGNRLLPELKPFLPATAFAQPQARAATGKPHGAPIAWGGAAVLGGVAWLLVQGLGGSEPASPQPAPTPAVVAAQDTQPQTPPARPDQAVATRPVPPSAEQAAASAQPADDAPAQSPDAAPATTETTPAAPADDVPISMPRTAGTGDIPSSPDELVARRQDAAKAISTLNGVTRAYWSTQSTILVELGPGAADPMPRLCPLLTRYAELAASRVQLQPPHGSDAPVRFRQCQAY